MIVFVMMVILMLIAAILLDIFGLICLIITFIAGSEIGEFLSFIPDILGFIFLGTGMGMGRSISGRQKSSFPKASGKQRIRIKQRKKGRFKFFLSFLGELAPFLGALPFWTFYVISESKHSNE